MALQLSVFNQRTDWPALDPAYLESQLALAGAEQAVRFERLMAYYRNDQQDSAAPAAYMDAGECTRPYVQAQEFGLPPRITGFRHDGFGAIFGGERLDSIRRRKWSSRTTSAGGWTRCCTTCSAKR